MIKNGGVYNVWGKSETWLSTGLQIPQNDNRDSRYFDSKYFTLTYGQLPYEACVALGTYDWGSEDTTGLVAIQIGATTSGEEYFLMSTDTTKHPPFTVAEVGTVCKKAFENVGENHLRLHLAYK